MTAAASKHHVTCPQAIAAENHKVQTGAWWNDREYRRITKDYLNEHKTCEYCRTRKSTVVHHDDPNSYRSREEYFNPDNFTPCCLTCHHQYRNGREICPLCRKHYMPRGNDQCRWCRGMPYAGVKTNRKRNPAHPCAHRTTMQRCHRDGRVFVCGRSSRNASGCDYFMKREAMV